MATPKSAPVKKAETKKTQPQPASASASTSHSSSQGMSLTGDIVFIGSKVTGSHTNRFKNWTGNVRLRGPIENAQFNFTVQTASVEADYLDPKPWSGKLQKHFLSADFFDVQNHPTATFVSSAIKKKKDDQYQVTGILTIRGQSKEISFPATINSYNGFNATAEFSINRKEYNIMYDGKADDLIREGVVLKINLKAKG